MIEVYKNSQTVPNVTVLGDVSATNVYANNIPTLTPLVCSATMSLSWVGLNTGDPQTDDTWVKLFDDSTATYAYMSNAGYTTTNTEADNGGIVYGGLVYDLGKIYNGRVFVEASIDQAGASSVGLALFVIGEDSAGGLDDPWKFTGIQTTSPTSPGTYEFFHLSTYFSGRKIAILGTNDAAYIRFHRLKIWTIGNIDL